MIYTYLRISSSELSFKNQESKLNDYCKKNNLVSKTTIYDISEGFCESSDNNLYKLIGKLLKLIFYIYLRIKISFINCDL